MHTCTRCYSNNVLIEFISALLVVILTNTDSIIEALANPARQKMKDDDTNSMLWLQS